MTAFSRRSKTGKLQICVWGGPGEPDLNDDANWTNIDEAEAFLREMADAASKPTGADNPFTPAGAARIFARWNANAPGRR